MVAIREFGPDDAEDVRRLFSEGQSQFAAGFEEDFEAYTRESLKADLSDIQGHYMDRPGSCFWVATVNGKVVGMVGIQRRDSHTGELRRMGVDINRRRQGIARMLLETAEEYCRQQGYSRLCLSTVTPLVPAIQMYQASGYTQTGQGKYGSVTVLHFSKELVSDQCRSGVWRS
ncbi:MAG: GNAT family N-acetyltransferase [Chloroflexota bacterium]|nr:GNAT family N-acetyltransferase [Chloroflexota bacterium]